MTHTNFTLSRDAERGSKQARWLTHFIAAATSTLLIGLIGCSQLPPPASTPAAPPASATAAAAVAPAAAPNAASAAPLASVPPAAALPSDADAGPLLHIDSASSLIAVTVRRSGVLARLGHDHVVAARAISGTVSPSRNSADFEFRLDQLTVDEAVLRKVAGLDTQPSADAIAGTRHNMLTKVLDAERYPLVHIHAERVAAGQPLQVSITLHGVTRTLAIPVDLREENGAMTVKGSVSLKQSDFGITPFSVMAGAMAVQDLMELRFDMVAKPALRATGV